MEKEQKLGIKVFYHYLYKKIFPGIFLLIFTSFILSKKILIASKIESFLSIDSSEKIIGYLITASFFISFLIIIISIISSYFKYIGCTFTIGENTFSIKRGVFSKKEISIPYQKIQDITIEQSFSDKIIGISKLSIQTAGNENKEAEAVFDMIDSKIAIELKEALLKKNGPNESTQNNFINQNTQSNPEIN